MARSVLVEDVSKQYRLGQIEHKTMLREMLVGLFKSPFRRSRTPRETIWALRNIGFTIDEGEVVGIIGRNGAGKSTLLKVLSGITYPTSGRIDVTGRVSSLLEVGTGFHEELTGRENVFLNGAILGMRKKEIMRKFDEMIAFAGVEKFVDTPIKRYSSGMKLRLGFAVAAHLESDVLMIDEVLAVGDAGFQKKCLKAMDDLRSGGRTVLFVSHNMSAIENLCPRTIWIDEGELREDGDTKDVIRAYMSTFATSQQPKYDLESIESRTGNGAARFTGMEFVDSDGQTVEFVRSGDALKVRLSFRVHEEVHNPHFAFNIYSDMGTLITTISTWGTGLDIPHLAPGEGQIDLEIDSLPLMPARYYLTLRIMSPGRVQYDIVEHIALDVETADVYATGKGLNSRWGLVFLPGRWMFDKAGRTTNPTGDSTR